MKGSRSPYVLTERRQPIAVIKPLKPAATEEAALQAMAEEGLITLPSRRGPMPRPRWRPTKIRGTSLAQTIIEDREDRT